MVKMTSVCRTVTHITTLYSCGEQKSKRPTTAETPHRASGSLKLDWESLEKDKVAFLQPSTVPCLFICLCHLAGAQIFPIKWQASVQTLQNIILTARPKINCA